jgi:HEAT repeat protein
MKRVVSPVVLLLAARIVALPSFVLAQPQQSATVAPPAVSQASPLAVKRTCRKSSVSFENDRLSVQTEDCPFDWFLEEISKKAHVAIITDEGLRSQSASTQFENVSLEEGLRRVLKDYDSFFFFGGDKGSPSRLKAVWVYSNGEGTGVVPVPQEFWASTKELEGKLKDPSPKVRASAIEAIIDRKRDKARDEVFNALKDPNSEVRTRALSAALNSGVDLPTQSLIDLFVHDKSPKVRFLSLDAMADSPEGETMAELALNDPDPHVQNAAHEILEHLGRPTSTPGTSRSPETNQPKPDDRN